MGWLLYQGMKGTAMPSRPPRALRDWAFADGGLTTLVSYCDPANARSIAVAERLGAVRDPWRRDRTPKTWCFVTRPERRNSVPPGPPTAPKGAPWQPCSAAENGLAPDPLRPLPDRRPI